MQKLTPMHLSRAGINYRNARDKRRLLCVRAIRDQGMTYRYVSDLTGVHLSQLRQWVLADELESLRTPDMED